MKTLSWMHDPEPMPEPHVTAGTEAIMYLCAVLTGFGIFAILALWWVGM